MDGFNGGGGGFINDSGGGSGPRSGGSGGGDRSDRNKGIAHANIAQIRNSDPDPEAAFQIDGRDLAQVIVVGVVRSIDRKSTKIQYQIEDFTGLIDVVQWVSAEDEDGNMDLDAPANQCREGMYVRCVGAVKNFGGKKNITAFKVNPIGDHNEITFHMLQTVTNHLKAVKGPLNPRNMNGATSINDATKNLGGNAANMNQYSAGYDSGAQNNSGLSDVQQKVMNVVNLDQSDEGVAVQTLCAQMNRFSEQQIRDALESLSNEGHVYSTIDDDHYKSTDS